MPGWPRSSAPGPTSGSRPAKGLTDIYLRSVLFGGAGFIVLCTLPILAKWVLIGRWKPRQIRIWSLGYVRFWIVKTLVRSNPLALLIVGSPLYVLYLRALGAKVGRGTVIFSRHVPVCTDLLTIGAGTVIRKDVVLPLLPGARGLDPDRPGHPRPGRVHRREDACSTSTPRWATWRSSATPPRCTAARQVPDGERWHGSPAQRTERELPEGPAGALRHAAPGQVLRRPPCSACSSCTCRWSRGACSCC